MIQFIVVAAVCLLIPIVVCVWFELGACLGAPWYVSAVSILLIGRFLMGLLEN